MTQINQLHHLMEAIEALTCPDGLIGPLHAGPELDNLANVYNEIKDAGFDEVRVAIGMEGGQIQWVTADQEVEVVVQDEEGVGRLQVVHDTIGLAVMVGVFDKLKALQP